MKCPLPIPRDPESKIKCDIREINAINKEMACKKVSNKDQKPRNHSNGQNHPPSTDASDPPPDNNKNIDLGGHSTHTQLPKTL